MNLKKQVVEQFGEFKKLFWRTSNKPSLPKALVTWRAPEFYLVKKNPSWGIVTGFFFATLAVLLVYLGQVLAALVAVLSGIVIIKFAYSKPEEIDYRVEPEGVRVSGWLHPYFSEIVAYLIVAKERRATLYLKTKNILNDRVAIPLGDAKPKTVSRALSKYIPEELPPAVPRVQKRQKR
ncbi:MAG TPA: hypothetical protein PLX55_02930 [bacterium]|nr:hypothetical protein [Patescibacteria group bacterium]HPM28081.1 hypothetical protein [bacterium]